MTCDDARLLLHAYLDNELDAAQSAAMMTHLRECSGCAAGYGNHARLHKALAQPELYRRAPHALREQWLAQSAAIAASPAPPARMRRAPIAMALAAGFAGALMLSSPFLIGAWQQRDAQRSALVGETISSHLHSLQGQHLMDVVSTDQHTVKPWFEGRLDFAPNVKDLSSEGFPLAGGRLDAIDGRSVAALIYHRRLHVINLYQWPAEADAHTQDTSQQHGYTVIRWTAAGMQYVAVSDVNENDLQQFVLAFQNDTSAAAAR